MKTNRHSTLLKKAVHLITYNSSHKLICLLGFLLLCSMNRIHMLRIMYPEQ